MLERRFRSLPINIDRMPRDAHELWHFMFLPPVKPDAELMRLMNEAYDVTTGLFRDAREVIRLQRHRERLLSQSFRVERGHREFRSVASRERGIDFHRRRFEAHLARYEALPPEGVLAEVDVADELPSIARKLGGAAVIRSPMRNLSSALQAA